MAYQTFRFEALRSDYDAVMNILRDYINQGRLVIEDDSVYIQGGEWIAHFAVLCTEELYDVIRSKLVRDWLVI